MELWRDGTRGKVGLMTDWQTILLTALVTTVGTGLVTYLGHRLTVRRDSEVERLRHATFLAVRVSAVLHPFVMSCVEVVADRGYRDQQGELFPDSVPPTLELPQDVDWRSIDPLLMDRVLSLPNEIASAEKTISFVAEVQSGPPDHEEWFEERRFAWAGLGLLALDIARDLRDRYELPQLDYSRYDPRDALEAAFRKQDEMRMTGAENANRIVKKFKAKKAGTTG